MTILEVPNGQQTGQASAKVDSRRIRRGDVFWVDFPNLNDHLMYGIHPAIIWSADCYCRNPRNHVICVVPLTSLKNRAVRRDQILITPPNAGVNRPVVTVTNMTGPVDRKRILGRKGSVDVETLLAIERCLLMVNGMKQIAVPEHEVAN